MTKLRTSVTYQRPVCFVDTHRQGLSRYFTGTDHHGDKPLKICLSSSHIMKRTPLKDTRNKRITRQFTSTIPGPETSSSLTSLAPQEISRDTKQKLRGTNRNKHNGQQLCLSARCLVKPSGFQPTRRRFKSDSNGPKNAKKTAQKAVKCITAIESTAVRRFAS